MFFKNNSIQTYLDSFSTSFLPILTNIATANKMLFIVSTYNAVFSLHITGRVCFGLPAFGLVLLQAKADGSQIAVTTP